MTWHDLNAAVADTGYAVNAHDHYYLSDNLSSQNQEVVFEDSYNVKKFCLHLNGKSLMNTGNDKAAIKVAQGATLSIMGNGNVGGPGSQTEGGSTSKGYPGAAVDNRSILNLYGGTYTSNSLNRPIISLFDEAGSESAYAINMFEGTVIDGTINGGPAPIATNNINDDTTGPEDGTPEEDSGETERIVAIVIAHGKNHNFNMYGGIIQNGHNEYSGGNVRVYRATFNMRGGVIENGIGSRGGNVAVGYGADGRFFLRGGTIQNGEAYNLGGNIYASNAFVMGGGQVKGGIVTMPRSVSETSGKVSASSGGSIAVVGGVTLLQGGTIDGTLPDNSPQDYNAFSGGLLYIARGEASIENCTLKNGTVAPYSRGSAVVVNVVNDKSARDAILNLKNGAVVEGAIFLQKSNHETKVSKITIQGKVVVGTKTGETITGGIILDNGTNITISGYMNSGTKIYVLKDADNKGSLVAAVKENLSVDPDVKYYDTKDWILSGDSSYDVVYDENTDTLIFQDVVPQAPDTGDTGEAGGTETGDESNG